MVENRLICPGCAAEYRLPPDAIPPAGREVECSACGHMWQARPPQPAPLDLGHFAASSGAAAATPSSAPPRAPDQPRPIPPASARLSASVLDILRGEVEHERRQRAAEAAAEGRQPPVAAPAPAAPDAASGAGAEPDWPATTVTMPTGAARAVLSAPQPQPAPQLDHGTLAPQAEAAPPAPAAAVIRHVPMRPAHLAAAEPARPAPRRTDTLAPAGRTRGRAKAQRAGFGLALMLGAAALALYLLAPTLAQSGNPIGQRLLELRHEVDRGRLWLQDQAGSLR